jgi:hypothetical protein
MTQRLWPGAVEEVFPKKKSDCRPNPSSFSAVVWSQICRISRRPRFGLGIGLRFGQPRALAFLHRFNCGARDSSVGSADSSAVSGQIGAPELRLRYLDDAAVDRGAAAAPWRQPGNSSWSLSQDDVPIAATAVNASLASLLGVTFVLCSWACGAGPRVYYLKLVTLLSVSNAVTAVGYGLSLRRLLPSGSSIWPGPSETPAAAASASRQMPLEYVPTAAAAGRRMRFAVSRCGWSLQASSPHSCAR